MNVTGLREVEAQLVKLGDQRGTKVLRAAMLAAAKPIAEQARANASAISRGSGSLALSIGVGAFRATNNAGFLGAVLPSMGGKFTVSVGPKRKHKTAVALYNLFYRRKQQRRGIYHAQFVEFSHRDRSGKTVAAQPILLPALRSRQAQAVAIFTERMRAGIARELRKDVKKAAAK